MNVFRVTLLIISCVFALVPAARADDPVFSEFRGMEDSLGNTHLFFKEYHGIPDYYSNDVHHMDLNQGVDSVLLTEHFYMNPIGFYDDGVFVGDFEFWKNDPEKYIYGGAWVIIDPTAYISRWDSVGVFTWLGTITNLEISRQNDSLVYAAIYGEIFKSQDMGFTWDFDVQSQPLVSKMISVSPFNDQVIFGENYFTLNSVATAFLLKSTDGGQTFSVVDSAAGFYSQDEFTFDPDSFHIYAVVSAFSEKAVRISNDGGSTWTELLTDSMNISMAIDEARTGTVFLSRGEKIYSSTDYGQTLNLYHQANRPVIGLYKKTGVDLLYAATQKEILEISPSGATVLKSLPLLIESGPSQVSRQFELAPNYPNPFNQSTTFEYSLGSLLKITLEIFDLNGRKLKTLDRGERPAGKHHVVWDGKDDAGRDVSSGIYFCRMKSGPYFQVRKLILYR